MKRFTSGDWKAFYGDTFHTIRQAHADDKQGHDYGNGELIAHVVQWHKGHDWANARLIAHAPEMYDMLYEVMQELKGYELKVGNKQTYYELIEELLARIDSEEASHE